MMHERLDSTPPVLSAENESSKPVIPGRCRVEREDLRKAFRDTRPLAILADNWTSDTNYIISSFLDDIESEVFVLRIDKTCSDRLEGMRKVIRATGFEPQNMTLSELQSTFQRFLSFQRDKHHRTVLLIEETRGNGGWVRDTVRHLVELETEGEYGLMVILHREGGASAPLNGQALQEDPVPVTAGLEKKSPKVPRLTPSNQRSVIFGVASENVGSKLNPDRGGRTPIKIILTHFGKILSEMTIDRQQLMIGRSRDNDLCINDKLVSRHHALIVQFGAAAMVADLNSSNGTYVSSRRIRDQVVTHDDIISIGNHQIVLIEPSCSAVNHIGLNNTRGLN